MAKRKRQKATASQKRQAIAQYTPTVRSRSMALSAFDTQLMHDAFLTNEQLVWERTSNCRVYQDAVDTFRIRLMRRERAGNVKGVRVTSSKFTTAIAAENAAFQFRYNLESKKSKDILDNHMISLRLRLSDKNNIAILPSTALSISSPLLRKISPNVSSSTRIKYAMSSNLEANLKVASLRNPNNCPPNTSSLFHTEFLNSCANKIQRAISNRDIRRSAKQAKMAMRNQTHRVDLIQYLSKFISTNTCDKLLLGSEDSEIMKSFSPFDRRHVQLKARHISDALQVMVNSYENDTPMTWLRCCIIATEMNYKVVKRGKTVAEWYLQLHRFDSLQFCRSERGRQSSQAKSPFGEDELLTTQFKGWARSDLEHLSIQKVQNFINNRLLADWTAHQLNANTISYPVTEYIVGRWMREAGFRYELHKKSYYVDRHEDPDVISDRVSYLDTFFRDEIFEHCWIQITKQKYDSLKRTKGFQIIKIKQEKSGDEDTISKVNRYVDKYCTHFYNVGEVEMVEMHVDYLYSYSDEDSKRNLPVLGPLGGSVSVRLPHGAKPRIWFGQDEVIYRSSQLNESCWTVDGESTLRTKGLGIGIMVSAFVSREFEFGMEISEEELVKVNEVRTGKKYTDSEAATYLRGSDLKMPLIETPFVRYLNYGSGKDGYWTYRHMVLQIEDCVDCLNILLPDQSYGFKLDHSSGHNMERPDGLSTTSSIINMGWGGKQRRMSSTVLSKDDIGTLAHERTVKVGERQSMVFDNTNLPPILSPGAPIYDVLKPGEKNKKLTKLELKQKLEELGMNHDGNVEQLKERATIANIPITKTQGIVEEGFMNKPKGAAQIICERGFTDLEGKLPDGRKVSMNGTSSKDPVTSIVTIDKTTSALSILKRCSDFQNEQTQMMFICSLLMVKLLLTPKCHPEIAGRGVEYAWGYSKLRF